MEEHEELEHLWQAEVCCEAGQDRAEALGVGGRGLRGRDDGGHLPERLVAVPALAPGVAESLQPVGDELGVLRDLLLLSDHL